MNDSPPLFQLRTNLWGELACTLADGSVHVSVTPVRAFPLTGPDTAVALMSSDGHELVWIPALGSLPPDQQAMIEAALGRREFMPVIQRIRAVSTFATPSHWSVDTDRGPATLLLKAEEDIRRLTGASQRALLITSAHGMVFKVNDWQALDKHSRQLLERFL